MAWKRILSLTSPIDHKENKHTYIKNSPLCPQYTLQAQPPILSVSYQTKGKFYSSNISVSSHAHTWCNSPFSWLKCRWIWRNAITECRLFFTCQPVGLLAPNWMFMNLVLECAVNRFLDLFWIMFFTGQRNAIEISYTACSSIRTSVASTEQRNTIICGY